MHKTNTLTVSSTFLSLNNFHVANSVRILVIAHCRLDSENFIQSSGVFKAFESGIRFDVVFRTLGSLDFLFLSIHYSVRHAVPLIKSFRLTRFYCYQLEETCLKDQYYFGTINFVVF